MADESGLSQRPHRVRTWAPRGKTPVLQYGFNWKSLSVAAGLTAWNFYFRLYPGAIKSPQVVDFLNALVRAIRRPMILVWDRLPTHRSRMVQDHIASLQGWIHQEYLPAYASTANSILRQPAASVNQTPGKWHTLRSKSRRIFSRS